MLPTGFLILPTFDSHQKCSSPGQREITELILTCSCSSQESTSPRSCDARKTMLASPPSINLAPSFLLTRSLTVRGLRSFLPDCLIYIRAAPSPVDGPRQAITSRDFYLFLFLFFLHALNLSRAVLIASVIEANLPASPPMSGWCFLARVRYLDSASNSVIFSSSSNSST